MEDCSQTTLHKTNLRKIEHELFDGSNVEQLMEIMSHELRTPLNTLIGVVDLMQADKMTDEQRLYIKTLEMSCAHLLSVVNRMQDLSGLQSKNPAHIIPFDPVAMISGVSESMQHLSALTGKGTQVSLDLDPHIPSSITGDLTRTQQVVYNLVGIANHASETKLSVLKATFEPTIEGRGRLYFTIKGDKVQYPRQILEGIDMQVSPTDLFNASSVHNMSQGIVLTREFLIRMGSKLSMDIDSSNCLTFNFHIDVGCNTEKKDYQAMQGTLKKQTSHIHILLVEDNLINLEITKRMISKIGSYKVSSSINGKDAVDKISKKQFDIVFMDCDMVGSVVLPACLARTTLLLIGFCTFNSLLWTGMKRRVMFAMFWETYS